MYQKARAHTQLLVMVGERRLCHDVPLDALLLDVSNDWKPYISPVLLQLLLDALTVSQLSVVELTVWDIMCHTWQHLLQWHLLVYASRWHLAPVEPLPALSATDDVEAVAHCWGARVLAVQAFLMQLVEAPLLVFDRDCDAAQAITDVLVEEPFVHG